jgi:hypothetical protein
MPLIRLLRTLLPLVFLLALGVFLWRKISPTLANINLLGNSAQQVTVTHNTVLTQVEALGKLELVRYRFKDVVEYKRSGRFQFLPDA